MGIPSLQVNKMRERFSGCCRAIFINDNGTCKWNLFVLSLALASVVIAAIGVVSLVMMKSQNKFAYRNVTSVRSNVVSSDPICEQLARETLALGGNSIDAVVAGAFCLSVVRPQSAGLGGGLMLLHFKEDAYFIDALDEAPSSDSTDSKVGVPGFLRGLAVGHQEFGGQLGFCSLMVPSILLASNGFQVSNRLADDLAQNEDRLSEGLKKYFTNPDTGCFYRAGEIMKMEKYSVLLRYLCTLGNEDFYFGHVAESLLFDFQEHNFTISKKDLRTYDVQVRPSGHLDVGSAGRNYELVYPINSGSGGEIASLAVAILAEVFRLQDESKTEADVYHATAEALKFAFASRSQLTHTGKTKPKLLALKSLVQLAAKQIVRKAHTFYNYPADYETRVFLPRELESHTASISVIDSDGDVTTAMMTLTSAFGSGILLNRTAIIMNNALTRFADVGLQSASINVFAPKRRPVSAMSPLLILTKENAHKEVIMTLAANNGGNQMISTTAQVVSNVLLRSYNLSEAFTLQRIHYQFLPNNLYIDTKPQLGKDVIRQLSSFGHNLQEETLKAEITALRVSSSTEKSELYLIDAIKEVE